MDRDKKKKLFLKLLAQRIKELRGDKSQFILSSEGDISTSIISTIERGLKDPQITTFFKISEALNIKPSKLLSQIENLLPEDFSFIEK